MIGWLGAKHWRANGVGCGNPVKPVPVAGGFSLAIGDTALQFRESYGLTGIALGATGVIVFYHFGRVIAPKHLVEAADGKVPAHE